MPPRRTPPPRRTTPPHRTPPPCRSTPPRRTQTFPASPTAPPYPAAALSQTCRRALTRRGRPCPPPSPLPDAPLFLPRDAAFSESPSHATPSAPRVPPTRRRLPREPPPTRCRSPTRRPSPTEEKAHSTRDLDALVVNVALCRKRDIPPQQAPRRGHWNPLVPLRCSRYLEPSTPLLAYAALGSGEYTRPPCLCLGDGSGRCRSSSWRTCVISPRSMSLVTGCESSSPVHASRSLRTSLPCYLWRVSLLRIAVRVKILSDSAWSSATSTHATFLEIIQLYCPGSWEAGATLVVTAVNTFFPITIPLCVPKLICAARLLTCTLLEVQEIQEVWQSRVVLEGITVAHHRSS